MFAVKGGGQAAEQRHVLRSHHRDRCEPPREGEVTRSGASGAASVDDRNVSEGSKSASLGYGRFVLCSW